MDSSAKHWDDRFRQELSKETDRAVAIIAAALLEQALENLLRNHFVPSGCQDDPLFDGPYAPLANFNAKIDIAHRVGLISTRWCRDLHLIRKIRNEFAHNVSGCAFGDDRVRSRIVELVKSQRVVEANAAHRDVFPAGIKGDLGMTVSFMLWMLWRQAEQVSQLTPRPDILPDLPDPQAGSAGNAE